MSNRVQKVSGARHAAREVAQISSSAMLSEAADRMRTLHTTSLPVVESNAVIGTITNRDIVQAVAAGRNPTTTPVKYAMTSNATSAPEEEAGNDAAAAGIISTRRTL